jgi:hypothetical protein
MFFVGQVVDGREHGSVVGRVVTPGMVGCGSGMTVYPRPSVAAAARAQL